VAAKKLATAVKINSSLLYQLTHYRPAIPLGNGKKYFRGSFQISIWSQFKEYHPSGNQKFNNLGIFQSLKLRILMEKILPISPKLNFTPNTLGLLWVNALAATANYFFPCVMAAASDQLGFTYDGQSYQP